MEHHLAAFVLSHELAHAYFDKEKTGDNYDTSVKKEIEECLANYVALLHAHNIGGLYYQIGKDLVNGQKGLKNKGYHHGLSLFNGDEPAFTGWWKWRYCHSIKEKASLNDLVAGSDLAAIFDLGLVKQQETTETLERE